MAFQDLGNDHSEQLVAINIEARHATRKQIMTH